MKTRFLFVLACGWTLSLALPARSDEIDVRFKQLDTNGDGKLSADELKDHADLQKLLKGADKNNDGFLTIDEIRTHLGRPAPQAKEPAPAPATPVKNSVREGPQVLAPASAGIGRMVPDAVLKDLGERDIKIKDVIGKNGLVVAFTSTVCPISKKYGPTLAKLEETLAAKGIGILYVNSVPNQKPEEMRVFVAAHKLKGSYVHDRDGIFGKTLGVTTTTEVFLIDSHRTLVYRGAIDDQYGLGYSRETPNRHYLDEAIQSLLANRLADPAATTAPGCELDLGKSKAIVSDVTYHNRISRIIQANCVECHHAGGVGPFSMDTYDDVVAHAATIRKVVEKGTMPPWFAVPTTPAKTSPWVNDRTMSDTDKTDLLAWLKSDRPKGNEADAPQPRTFEGGWLIGKPDAVYQFEKPVAVKATGIMPYQKVTVETHLTEDKWVKALEVRPSAREVVHHVLVFILPPKKEPNARDPEGDESSGFFAPYVPGQSVLNYPEGYAKKLPKGSRLFFQMHYTPNGTATEDQTRIGLIFAKNPPEHEVRVVGIANTGLKIPAGASHHPEAAKLKLPADVTVLAFLPHMHLRGQAFRYEITPPGGKKETVLDVPNFDFNWQLYYRLAQPLELKKDTVIDATGWFDNSKSNPANPDASKTVRWGPQTYDEMMLGYVEYVVPVGSSVTMGNLRHFDPADIFKKFDLNGDGKIDKDEYANFVRITPQLSDNPLVAQLLWSRLDVDKDGVITLEEFKKLRK
ncbi:EF-hand domain-containing protein [Zavarzinella formosa]|uniref:EF-hand domain-containing protein n=1 Tax=Zavarzinella formosa TaxID=360055 RepID=UPI00030EA3D7|nr:EF-hand domain-containing protein [Zavarzinella formosa]